MVHKSCISLSRIIKSKWHEDHHIFHTYFLEDEDFKSWDCIICHDEVNIEHGSYCCSDCKIIFHVNCLTKDKGSYVIVNENEESSEGLELFPESITCVFERNDAGEATKIKHFKHAHNLNLGDKITDYDKCCDGCMLPISNSFYYCPQCDFFLHKACAELRQMKHVWHHYCQQPLVLTSDEVFRCEKCSCWSNAFAYTCNECEEKTCLRCVTALTPGAQICPKHEHPLLYYREYKGQCSACGDRTYGAFRCKDINCNFVLDRECFSLPNRARHKCDEHILALTYHDNNDYSESHYCDICEERRNPDLWFYYCVSCDNSAHINCVLGEYPFIKLGGIFKDEDHLHPLTFVKKMYYYAECIKCGKPCEDLALECAESGCNYIVHWKYKALDAVIAGERDLRAACNLVSILSYAPNCCLPIYKLSRHSGQLGLILSYPHLPGEDLKGFWIEEKVHGMVKRMAETTLYTSSYADASHLDPRTDVSEKRIVGVFHELLLLTIQKKTERKNMSGTQAVVLREAYDCGRLIQRQPLVDIRERFASMMRKGFLDISRGLYKKTTNADLEDPSKIVHEDKAGGNGLDSETRCQLSYSIGG
ncbi:hypothetical protein REPUB_Repub20aG0043800 [Reevesia pubescens]